MYLLNEGDTTNKSWPHTSLFKVLANYSDLQLLLNHDFAITAVLIPIISVLGIIGNVTSIYILSLRSQSGSSNILLLSLAVADTLFIVGTNNIPLKIYLNSKEGMGFFFTEPVALLIYFFLHVELAVESIGRIASMTLPILITLERIFAVFIPFSFSRILTPQRIRMLICFLFTIWIPDYTVLVLLTRYEYTTDLTTIRGVGRILTSEKYSVYMGVYNISRRFYFTLLGPVSVGLVVAGCVMIGVKVKVLERQRRSLVSATNREERLSSMDVIPKQKLEGNTLEQKRLENISEKTLLDNASKQTLPESRREQPNCFMFYKCERIFLISNQRNFRPEYSESNSSYAKNRSSSAEIELNEEIKHKVYKQNNTDARFSNKFTASCISGTVTNIKSITLNTVKTIGNTNSASVQSCPANQKKVTTSTNIRGRRTTTLLLAVCIIYSITCGFSFLTVYVFNDDNFDFTTSLIAERFAKLALCINSASNFVVYVVLNPRFRKTFQRCCACFKRAS